MSPSSRGFGNSFLVGGGGPGGSCKIERDFVRQTK